MAIQSIVTIPNKVLAKKCEVVTTINAEIKDIIQDLRDTLQNSKIPGSGLAANQIGKSVQICVVRDFYPNPKNMEEDLYREYVMINPEIVVDSRKEVIDWEGCLSIPDTYGMVKRFKKIKVKFVNENGEKATKSAENLFARTIQHEVDHLNGILFTNRVIGNTRSEQELDELFEGKKLG